MKKLYKNVFMIDDNKIDIMIVKKAFEDNDLIHKVSSFMDSSEFIKYAQEKSILRTIPDVILLDLNMPEPNGLQVTNILRQNKNYADVPIIILSNSENQNDIYQSYNNGANIFIKKPEKYPEWVEVVKSIDQMWL